MQILTSTLQRHTSVLQRQRGQTSTTSSFQVGLTMIFQVLTFTRLVILICGGMSSRPSFVLGHFCVRFFLHVFSHVLISMSVCLRQDALRRRYKIPGDVVRSCEFSCRHQARGLDAQRCVLHGRSSLNQISLHSKRSARAMICTESRWTRSRLSLPAVFVTCPSLFVDLMP